MKRSGFKNKINKPMKRSGFLRKVFNTGFGAPGIEPTNDFKVLKFVSKRSKLRKNSIQEGPKLEKALWTIFALYIKWRDNWTCFICGKRYTDSRIHAGHFIEDAIGGLILRFNERNVHAQCEECNSYKNTNKKYELRMLEVYGQKVVDELRMLKWKVIKDFPFKEKIELYPKLRLKWF